MLRSQHAQFTPQQSAAPQRPTILHYFLAMIVALALMDIWFDFLTGWSVPQMIVRHFGWMLSKGGR